MVLGTPNFRTVLFANEKLSHQILQAFYLSPKWRSRVKADHHKTLPGIKNDNFHPNATKTKAVMPYQLFPGAVCRYVCLEILHQSIHELVLRGIASFQFPRLKLVLSNLAALPVLARSGRSGHRESPVKHQNESRNKNTGLAEMRGM